MPAEAASASRAGSGSHRRWQRRAGHKATVDSASSIGLSRHINGNILDDGFALLPDDLDAVDVLRDDLDGGLRLPLADGGIPLRLTVARTLDSAEANQSDAEHREGQQPARPRNHAYDASPMHCRYSSSRAGASPPHSRALAGGAHARAAGNLRALDAVKAGLKKQVIKPLDAPQEFLSEATREREARSAAQDTALRRAPALAHHWQRLLDEQRASSVAEIAEAEGMDVMQVRRVMG